MAEEKISMDVLAQSQRETGDIIQGIIKNYKKDSQSRKTLEYYKERLRRLNSAWADFEITDNKIRCLENPPLDHDYFVSNYYTDIAALVEKYRQELESAMMQTPVHQQKDPTATKTTNPEAEYQHQELAAAKSTITMARTQAHNQPPPIQQQAMSSPTPTPSARASQITLSIRRQNVMISSLKRVITTDPTATNMKLKEKLWEQIQELHFSIWENCANPLEEGYDMDSYTDLEEMVIQNFKHTTVPAAQYRAECAQTNVLPLPKITIPKFDGDYLKWPAFADLFSQLVVNQNIPAVQKIWYLKANVTGEA